MGFQSSSFQSAAIAMKCTENASFPVSADDFMIVTFLSKILGQFSLFNDEYFRLVKETF